ncbi:MAG: hypothetical protein IH936_01130 [Acidobacteria bacterium]|nr:hypothetical protein [Acidobacteriota bacterium]
MIRSLAAILTLAAGWSFTDLSLDHLRWNARERTAAGIEALETHPGREGIEAFETAARLDPEDPILRFNAGSAHLVAGTDGALEHLERAAEFAPDELRAPANYNLANARLGADDTAGAIAAYEQTLRLSPDHQAAKFNLELALKQQQQEQDKKDRKGQDDKPDDRKPQNQQPSDNRDNDKEQEQQQDSNEPEQNGQDGQDQEQDESERSRQLPQFEEQPDMTAEQAAAILEAVENLERAQRRKQAEEQMKKRARKGKDW